MNEGNIFSEAQLESVKNVILVASGKGGVGKSTVAANLAIALNRAGNKTGLLDADLYGPSMPMLFNLEDAKPHSKKIGDKDYIVPVEKDNIKIMSIGFVLNKEDPVIWRGPMASNALNQLITETDWGQLDYLVVDLPPGTGDINITIAQKLRKARAIVVITPQQLAVSDGRKAVNMFKNQKLSIPLLGIIENMSYFVPEKHPDEKYMLFGQGGGRVLADEFDVPLLAQIPLVSDVCELGDTGRTIFESSNQIIVDVFEKLATGITASK